MSSFSKMVLIPADEADRLRDKKISQYNPIIRKLAKLDQEMEEILNEENIGIEEKLARYQTTLLRFQQIYPNKTPSRAAAAAPAVAPAAAAAAPALAMPAAPAVAMAPLPVLAAHDAGLGAAAAPPVDPWLADIDANQHENATALIGHFKKHPDKIAVDNLGQLVLNGHVIERSNFKDLLTSFYSPNFGGLATKGRKELVAVMKDINTPPEFIGLPGTRDKLKQAQGGNGPPRSAQVPSSSQGKHKRRAVVGTSAGPPGVRVKIMRVY